MPATQDSTHERVLAQRLPMRTCMQQKQRVSTCGHCACAMPAWGRHACPRASSIQASASAAQHMLSVKNRRWWSKQVAAYMRLQTHPGVGCKHMHAAPYLRSDTKTAGAAHLSTASAKGISLSAATVMPCPCLAHTACCSALSLSRTQGLSCKLDRQRVSVVLEVSCPASSTSSRLLLISASVNLRRQEQQVVVSVVSPQAPPCPQQAPMLYQRGTAHSRNKRKHQAHHATG